MGAYSVCARSSVDRATVYGTVGPGFESLRARTQHPHEGVFCFSAMLLCVACAPEATFIDMKQLFCYPVCNDSKYGACGHDTFRAIDFI